MKRNSRVVEVALVSVVVEISIEKENGGIKRLQDSGFQGMQLVNGSMSLRMTLSQMAQNL